MMKKILLIVTIIFTTFYAQKIYSQSANEKAVDEMNKVLTELSDYNYGDPQLWKPKLIEAMKPVYYNDAVKMEVEKLMLAFIKSDVSTEAKQAVQREFSQIATKESEKEILDLLKNKKTENIALYILDNAELGTVKQFKEIVTNASDPIKTGIINMLGNRKDEKAVDLLKNLSEEGSEQISMAAISALAKIGTSESVDVLVQESKKLPVNLNNEIAEIKLKSAYSLLKNGYKSEAENIFQDLNNSTQSVSIQSAALNGLFETSNEKPAFITTQLKNTSNPELKSQIIRLIIELPEKYKNGKEFFEIAGLSVQDKIQLLKILGVRKDKSIHNIVLDNLNHDNQELQKAALEVIPKIGSADDLIVLAKIAAEKRGEMKELARNAMYTLSGENVDKQIIKLMASNEFVTDIKTELIKATGERHMTNASDILFVLAKSENAAIKTEAIEALGNIGNYSDLGKIMELLVNSTSARERNDLEGAAFLMAEQNPNISESSEILNTYLKESDVEKNITSVISILGKLGNPDDYKVISDFYESSNPELKSAAIRAVAEWPTSQPLDDLTKIIKTTQDARQHALSMRSYLQIIDSNDEMGMSEKIDKLNTASQLSNNLIEKRMIISAYSRLLTIESLQQLVLLMNEPEIRREVEIAIQEMAPSIRSRDEMINTELEKAVQLSENESFINSIKEVIKRRSQY